MTTAMRSANLLLDYADRLPAVAAALGVDPDPRTDPEDFSPGFRLPPPGPALERFLDKATVNLFSLGEYRGHRLDLLDLRANPGTHTTKTFASLLIVARAVAFIRSTGQPVMIISPSSGNKATALRDAVEHALHCGLVQPEELRVAVVVPAAARPKLRETVLSTDPGLRALNPVFVYDGPDPEGVKALTAEVVRENATTVHDKLGAWLWPSLNLDNYLYADAARAFADLDLRDQPPSRPYWNAHAVSSAFGLLGYHVGRTLLEKEETTAGIRPGYFLVQHLGTPDMVLSLRTGSFDRAGLPAYQESGGPNGFVQDSDPAFPGSTDDPQEVLDPTFYSRRPKTAERMNDAINERGGAGIVVSKQECRRRYQEVRRLGPLAELLPADHSDLREWSLSMVMTGVLEAVDRGAIPAGTDVLIHASGSYSVHDYDELKQEHVTPVSSARDVIDHLLR